MYVKNNAVQEFSSTVARKAAAHTEDVCRAVRSLDNVVRGGTVKVYSVIADGDTKRHLESMGFVCGADVNVISEICGNMIISVKGARMAISKELAGYVMVH